MSTPMPVGHAHKYRRRCLSSCAAPGADEGHLSNRILVVFLQGNPSKIDKDTIAEVPFNHHRALHIGRVSATAIVSWSCSSFQSAAVSYK